MSEGEKIDFALVNTERLRREPQTAILNEHRHLHGLAELGEVDCAELERIHKLVVDEMTRRGLEHNSPLVCKAKAGLKLNEPHAYLVWKGKKKSIALPAEDGKGLDGHLVGVPLVLCQNGAAGAEAYGEAILGNPAAMTPAQFDLPEYADCHCVRPEERREWWDGVKQFYVYPIKSFARYDKPRPVLLQSGCKCYLPDVRFKQYVPPTAKEQEILRQSERLPKQIILTPRAVSLTGSMLYGNHEPRDVDMVVVGAEWRPDEDQFVVPLSPTFKEKLERVLRAVYQTGNAVQYISEGEGPTFDHLPLYALALVRLPRLEVEHVSEIEPEMAEMGYDKDGAKGIRQLFGSPGGKAKLAHSIIEFIPEHKTYVEPFAGGGAVFFAKEPSGAEVLSDLDENVIRAYKFVRNGDIEALKKQNWKVSPTHFKEVANSKPESEIGKVYRWLYLKALSWGGQVGDKFGHPERTGDELGIPERLEAIKERLGHARILRKDFREVLSEYDAPDTFFYLDPPYPEEKFNREEVGLSFDDLVEAVKGLKGKWILSLRNSPEARKAFTKYHIHKLNTSEQMDTWRPESTPRKELLISNFPLEKNKSKALTASEVERELRGASPTVRRQALQSYTDDAVLPGRPFVPLKPMRPAKEGLRQVFSRFADYVESMDSWPEFVSAKRDGMRVTFHRRDGKVTAYSDDGKDTTATLPELVKRLEQVKGGDFVLDSEVERWDDQGQHYPREAAAGAIHSGEGTADLIANVFDVLYWDGKDLHRQPFVERLKVLNTVPADTKSDDALKPSQGLLNVIPHYPVKDRAELEKLCLRTAYKPGVEGVVVKRADGDYPLDGEPGAKPVWVKFHKSAAFKVVVLQAIETKTPGVFNYVYGIPAGDAKPVEPFELDGKTYMVIGKSFSTAEKFKPGDEIEIESETVNFTQNDDGTVEVSFWVPTVIQSEGNKFSAGQPRDSWGRWSSWGGDLPNIEPGTDILSYSESFQDKEFPRQIMANTGSLDVALISEPKDIVAKLKDNEFDAQKFKANGAYELNMALQDADDPKNVKAIWNGGNRIQEAWKQTSNNSGGAQDLLQVEAARRLPAGTDHATTHGMELAQKWNSAHPGNEKVSASVYDNIQGRTQEYFASKGFKPDDEITVFRGIDGDIGDELSLKVNPGDPANIISSRPLSSWSLDPVTARMFSDDSGVVIAAKVRVGDVFSHFSTGFGCMDENEVILPAGSAKNGVVIYSNGTAKGLKAKTKIALDDTDQNADWIQTLEKKREAGKLYPLKGKDWRV